MKTFIIHPSTVNATSALEFRYKNAVFGNKDLFKVILNHLLAIRFAKELDVADDKLYFKRNAKTIDTIGMLLATCKSFCQTILDLGLPLEFSQSYLSKMACAQKFTLLSSHLFGKSKSQTIIGDSNLQAFSHYLRTCKPDTQYESLELSLDNPLPLRVFFEDFYNQFFTQLKKLTIKSSNPLESDRANYPITLPPFNELEELEINHPQPEVPRFQFPEAPKLLKLKAVISNRVGITESYIVGLYPTLTHLIIHPSIMINGNPNLYQTDLNVFKGLKHLQVFGITCFKEKTKFVNGTSLVKRPWIFKFEADLFPELRKVILPGLAIFCGQPKLETYCYKVVEPERYAIQQLQPLPPNCKFELDVDLKPKYIAWDPEELNEVAFSHDERDEDDMDVDTTDVIKFRNSHPKSTESSLILSDILLALKIKAKDDNLNIKQVPITFSSIRHKDTRPDCIRFARNLFETLVSKEIVPSSLTFAQFCDYNPEFCI